MPPVILTHSVELTLLKPGKLSELVCSLIPVKYFSAALKSFLTKFLQSEQMHGLLTQQGRQDEV